MTNILNYIKNIFKVLIWPIIFIIGQFLLIIIFSAIFNGIKYNEIKTTNNTLNKDELTIVFNEYLKTNDYKNSLTDFISSNMILITIITFIVFFIIFYLLYKKYKINYTNKLSIKNILFLLILGFCLNITYNITMSNINNIYNFTNSYDSINIDLFTYIICTGILGPILEEFLFRGIIYNKLKKFNKNMTAIILTGLIFSLFHSNIIQILYTFCLNFILIYVYIKFKSLKAPIIVHIASNIINIFICQLIINHNFLLNNILLIFSLFCLTIINFKFMKNDKV